MLGNSHPMPRCQSLPWTDILVGLPCYLGLSVYPLQSVTISCLSRDPPPACPLPPPPRPHVHLFMEPPYFEMHTDAHREWLSAVGHI